MNLAIKIDDDVGTVIASREKIALVFEGAHEGLAVAGVLPKRGDVRAAFGLGDAGALLLLLLAEIFLRGAVVVAVPATVPAVARFHAIRQFEPVVAREFLRDRAQLQPVVGHLHGLHVVGVDAGPDGVAMFAQDAVLVALFVEHDGAGLADQLQAALGPLQQLKVLFAGKTPVGLVRIEGEAVKEFLAPRAARFGSPFGESAGEILRDGAAHIGDFNALVVERVLKMGSKLLSSAALIALEDHKRS